ncbi:MAG: hypothetical protein R3B48_29440 [Kofleriaceae bacterium]
MKTKQLSIPTLGLGAALSLAACAQTPMSEAQLRAAVCPSPELVEHAVCVCGDFSQTGRLTVKEGPAGVGSVGVNGVTDLVAQTQVSGSWYAWGGFSSVGQTAFGPEAAIGGSLITPGDLSNVGTLSIAGDVHVGGDLDSTGALTVGGMLGVRGTTDLVGEHQIASRGDYLAPAAAPCGCDEASMFDVGQAVEAARISAGGETSEELIGEATVRLTTGAYYLKDPSSVGNAVHIIEGNVSLFVDGSLDSVGSAEWKIAPGGHLDLFVSGDVSHVGNLVAGSDADPDAFRLYVGGQSAAIDAVGESAFFGSIYAPQAMISYVGDTRVVGSIYAKQLDGVGDLTVEYGRPVLAPSSCDAPPAPPAPGGDAE